MGKKKVGFKKAHSKIDALENAASSDEDEIEQHLQSILEDEIDQYNTLKEQSLLDKAGKKAKGKKRKQGQDPGEDEEEIYDLGLTSSEEEDDDEKRGKDLLRDTSEEEDEDDEDEDILGNDDNYQGIPDSRAWGKKAKMFHNTDYVDQDFGGLEGSDGEMAEQEEAEAKEIQKRLNAELDESDFLGLIPVKPHKSKKSEKTKEILKVDFDNLSIAEKRKLVQRECPEVIHMLDEYKDKLKEAKATKASLEIEEDEFLKGFYQSKYLSLLNYCINISYYLYLRSTSPTNCKGHPVIKRILQFRRLLDELAQFNIKKYTPVEPPSSKKLKKRKSVVKKPNQSSSRDKEMEMGDALDLQNVGKDEEMEDDGEVEKRGITYTIAKNKGMTPKRKREQRNPRVKHREKYRKAKIRRKGQVRTPRTETHRYEGEMSGIKSNVIKSIKLK